MFLNVFHVSSHVIVVDSKCHTQSEHCKLYSTLNGCWLFDGMHCDKAPLLISFNSKPNLYAELASNVYVSIPAAVDESNLSILASSSGIHCDTGITASSHIEFNGLTSVP